MDPTIPRTGSEPILVMGYMHSGTTLLRNVLGRHGAVFVVPGETKFFQKLPAFRRQFPDLGDDETLAAFVGFVADIALNGHTFKGDPGPREKVTVGPPCLGAILEEAKRDRDHAAIFRIVMDHLAREFGRARWLCKKPTTGFFLEGVLRAVPDALFVEVVRDPRDVLASKKTRRLGVWGTGRYRPEQRASKHLEKAYDPLWDALSWKSTVLALRRASARWPGRFLSIRYEDLVAEPEARVREICAFLGLEFDPELLNVARTNTAERGGHEPSQEDGIVPASVGRWRRVLAPPEVALCEFLTRGEMARLGYARSSVAPRHVALTPLLAARGGIELIRRPIRRLRLGGPSYFAIVMNIYWKRLLQIARG